MKTKIPKRGPVDIRFSNGLFASLWYLRGPAMSWVLQLLDEERNQIGPACDGTAEYWHNRADAVHSLMQLAERNGGFA
jgi:hypothetical protein